MHSICACLDEVGGDQRKKKHYDYETLNHFGMHDRSYIAVLPD
jgi:hypothetical protein